MKYFYFVVILLFYNCTFVASSKPQISSEFEKISEGLNNGIQLRVLSWNIQNFGESKMKNDSIMNYIAEVINSYDIVVIQEVSTSIYGAKAVAKLDGILDRMGSNWDYAISDPTEGAGTERYAYIFKPSRIQLKKAFLEKVFETSIEREPYLGIFEFRGNLYNFYNIHLVPEGKNPEKEASALCMLSGFKGKHIVLGDFNLSEKHRSFDCLKKTYKASFENEKTSLKMEVKDGVYLNKEYDNAFISSEVTLISKGVVHFYKDFDNIKSARAVSDHCPIFITIK